MPSVASEMSAFVRRPDHHGLRNAAAHVDEHAKPFSALLDETSPEPEPEPAGRSGPTRVEPAEKPNETAEAPAAGETPVEAAPETQGTDGAAQPDGQSPDAPAQAQPDVTTGVVELPGQPSDAPDDGETADAAVAVVAPASAPVNQTAPAAALVQPGTPAVAGAAPAEGGDVLTAPGGSTPAAPQGDAKPAAPATAMPATGPAAQPAGGVPDTEAAAMMPAMKAATAKPADEKPHAKPAAAEIATLAPDQQPQDTKKIETPGLPQPAKPETAARPRVAADALQPADAAEMFAGDIEMKPHGEQVQTASLAAAQTQTTQAAGGSSAAAQAQQAPLVPVAGLAVEIAAQARAGKNRFEIRLDPPELGRIDVRLDVDREGNVTSRLVVERAETLDLLRRDAHSLERALNQAGLKTSDNSLQFSLRDQGADQGQRDGEQRSGERLIMADEDHPAAQPVRNYGRLLGLGAGLDIRV